MGLWDGVNGAGGFGSDMGGGDRGSFGGDGGVGVDAPRDGEPVEETVQSDVSADTSVDVAGDEPVGDASGSAAGDEPGDGKGERKPQGKQSGRKRNTLPKLDRGQAKRYGALWDALQDDRGREVARQLTGNSSDDPAKLFDLLSELKLDSLPRMDGSQARRFRELWDALKDESGVAVAKLLASSNSPMPEALIEALTGTKVRNSVEEWLDMVKRVRSEDVVHMQMNLVSVFTNDSKLSATMFRLFAAVGADVGRASGDPVRDAMTLGRKWAEGVDLSVIEKMRV